MVTKGMAHCPTSTTTDTASGCVCLLEAGPAQQQLPDASRGTVQAVQPQGAAVEWELATRTPSLRPHAPDSPEHHRSEQSRRPRYRAHGRSCVQDCVIPAAHPSPRADLAGPTTSQANGTRQCDNRSSQLGPDLVKVPGGSQGGSGEHAAHPHLHVLGQPPR